MELAELLLAREERVRHQQELLQTYNLPLICLTMNIPGPIKNNTLITKAFLLGERYLKAQFPNIIYGEHRILDTGCEGYYILPGQGAAIKALCMELEEQPPLGRLLDLDVLTVSGQRFNRSAPRLCLLCGEDARLCRRRGSHPIEAIAARAMSMLREALDQDLAQRVSSLAVRSLLYELLTTPKPGLVDMRNNGSHRDMDPFTFAASAASLGSFFRQCCLEGCHSREKSPEALLPTLRFLGREAEATMYRATGGINTHKGAIFSLGLLCAAVGKLGKEASARELCEAAAGLCRGTLERELSRLTPSTAETMGEKLYCSHGITGARGQAMRGFPTVLNAGLPVLEKGLALGYDLNRAGVAALLAMLREEPDTCLISRSSPGRYAALREELEELLRREPYPTTETLEALDNSFIRENLSSGGSADLLALTYFLLELRSHERL